MIRSLHCLVLLIADYARSHQVLTGSKCYGDLGCLELNRRWYHDRHRPVNVYPVEREVINTKFDLYTRDNPLKAQKLSAAKDDYILKSNFNATRETKFIIHGFIDTTGFTSWIKEMRLELLEHAPVNVFEVDWNKGSTPPYTQATANTRLVGLEVAFFINHLKEKYGLNPTNVHIIGHSLGAHTAGYAGQKIPGLGRITGLDPAGPYFHGMGRHVRLDPSDAAFVDVIHTDIYVFGMTDPCGHIDFYPHNGTNQPGCDITDTLTSPLTLAMGDTVDEEGACNHLRAISLFNESINSQCSFVGQHCSNYELFLQGKCSSTNSNAVMGFRATKVSRRPLIKYFLLTNGAYPFCRQQDQAGKKFRSTNPWINDPSTYLDQTVNAQLFYIYK